MAHQLRQSLGLSVLGGMLLSQLITPVIYLALYRYSGSGPLKLDGES